ncbi:Nif11 family protein [Pseudoroseomonas cervicalis]|uniref:Nif11 family protein n=1 Tax=Teichococcus cervicalis TaxID=204525 RepID=UPI0022F1D1A1|nr:Nif11 family protein [Pseudoroseomonas cervicalis]WBV42077.1 Nif11 family protein [Pseudoroseomonas cervicalis]
MPHPEIERLITALPQDPALRARLCQAATPEALRTALAGAGYAIPPEALPGLRAVLASPGPAGASQELGDAALDQVQGGVMPVKNFTSPFD